MVFHATEQEREDGADKFFWTYILENMAEAIGRLDARWTFGQQEIFDILFKPALDALDLDETTRKTYVEKIWAGLK